VQLKKAGKGQGDDLVIFKKMEIDNFRGDRGKVTDNKPSCTCSQLIRLSSGKGGKEKAGWDQPVNGGGFHSPGTFPGAEGNMKGANKGIRKKSRKREGMGGGKRKKVTYP